MALAALAILGHRSAHSFPMGPVIADPAEEPPQEVVDNSGTASYECFQGIKIYAIELVSANLENEN